MKTFCRSPCRIFFAFKWPEPKIRSKSFIISLGYRFPHAKTAIFDNAIEKEANGDDYDDDAKGDSPFREFPFFTPR